LVPRAGIEAREVSIVTRDLRQVRREDLYVGRWRLRARTCGYHPITRLLIVDPDAI
jgi:hypothetical protein